MSWITSQGRAWKGPSEVRRLSSKREERRSGAGTLAVGEVGGEHLQAAIGLDAGQDQAIDTSCFQLLAFPRKNPSSVAYRLTSDMDYGASIQRSRFFTSARLPSFSWGGNDRSKGL